MLVDEPMDSPLKIGVSASSKKFKRAVDRNRIKRLVKEHYRVNKHPLHAYLEGSGKQLVIFFMYIDKALPENALLQRKMPLIIDKLINTLSESISQNN
jgi:ribonuclease P protein component